MAEILSPFNWSVADQPATRGNGSNLDFGRDEDDENVPSTRGDTSSAGGERRGRDENEDDRENKRGGGGHERNGNSTSTQVTSFFSQHAWAIVIGIGVFSWTMHLLYEHKPRAVMAENGKDVDLATAVVSASGMALVAVGLANVAGLEI